MADQNPSTPPPVPPILPRRAGAVLRVLRRHRVYRAALGYAVAAWAVLQVAAIVLPAFAAPPWVLRGVMVLLALGFGAALLAGWGHDRRLAGRPLLPRAPHGRLGWALTAVLPATAVAVYFLGHPLPQAASGGRSKAPASSSKEEGAAPEKSIAVLPFDNRSSDQENGFFTDGVQDEILTNLARVADLKVISRTSVRLYRVSAARNLREIGQQLGAAYLLEGSVQRAGSKVRVTAKLINARTDAHLWADTYDRPLGDVFAIQSEIAEAIAGQLCARLSPQEKQAIAAPPTTDLAAFDLFARARALYADTTDPVHAREKLPQAVRALELALRRDPGFLTAWCLLARLHCSLYWQGIDHTPERLAQSRAAAEAAVRLRPDAGETHLALADYYYHGFRNYARARAELDLARRTLPNCPEVDENTGYIDRREGRWEAAARRLERALELDPRNFFTLQQVALTYAPQRRYAAAARALERALAILPGDPSTRMSRASLDVDARADLRPYQSALAALLAEDPGLAPDLDDPFYSLCERTPAAAARVLASFPREGVAINGTLCPHAYWEGAVARWQGDAPRARAAFTAARAEVEKSLETAPDHAIAVSLLGIIDAGLGRKQEALAEGRRACELLPVGQDAIDGAAIAANLAQTLAWTGEKAAAVEQIAAVERAPNLLTYGLLKLHPVWDDLRGDARFEALVASLGPGGNDE